MKDVIPPDLKSFVVYYFCCAGCNARDGGETTRHLMIRIKEQISTHKNSIISKHLENNVNCKRVCNKDNFQ